MEVGMAVGKDEGMREDMIFRREVREVGKKA